MAELPPEVEQQLADLSDEDYRALLARVRPPNGEGTLKSGAALYDKQHGRKIDVEGAERITNGKWS